MTATASLSVSSLVGLDGQSTFAGLFNGVVQPNLKNSTKYTSGQLIAVSTTLSGGLSVDLNSVTNVHNEAVNIATLYLLLAFNDDTSNDIVISGNAMSLLLDDAAHTLTLPAQSGGSPSWCCFENPDGWTVVNATSDTITFTESAGTADLRYYLIGAE